MPVTVMINYIFISFSAVHIYDLSCIHLPSSPSTVYYELAMWPAPRWLESSVSRALHRYRRVYGLDTVQALFSGFNFTTAYVVRITAMINHVFISFSAVEICDLSYIHLQCSKKIAWMVIQKLNNNVNDHLSCFKYNLKSIFSEQTYQT